MFTLECNKYTQYCYAYNTNTHRSVYNEPVHYILNQSREDYTEDCCKYCDWKIYLTGLPPCQIRSN